jgi:tetratricopeptide (TPR) repeat protein
MTRRFFPAVFIFAMVLLGGAGALESLAGAPGKGHALGQGSDAQAEAGCGGCHGAFMSRWKASVHGRCFETYSDETAGRFRGPKVQDVRTGNGTWRVDLRPGKGAVGEKGAWPWSARWRKISFILGARDVIILFSRGKAPRYEALPVCYDTAQGRWKDTRECGVRHAFAGRRTPEGRDIVFDTSCLSCHVGQVPGFYDLRSDSYSELKAGRGILCDACHGPTAAHAEAASQKGYDPRSAAGDIAGMRGLDPAGRSGVCAPCHASSRPITAVYRPGEPSLDHFDFSTLEDKGFTADARSEGGMCVYPAWFMNPCARALRLDCTHCHEAGGSFRFMDKARINGTCLPCHGDKAAALTAHTHHEPGSTGSACIACHMGVSPSGGRARAGHSMLGPMPELTSRYKTRNGCTCCHVDRDDAWADQWVKAWYPKDYQRPYMYRAGLVEDARAMDWTRLDDMIDLIGSKGTEELYPASLARLLAACPDPSKEKALRAGLGSPSPLVRAASAEGIAAPASPAAIVDLIRAAGDPVRLVRVKAASTLLRNLKGSMSVDQARAVSRARSEYIASLMVRPDQWSSHVDMGVFFLEQGDAKSAVLSFKAASKLDPLAVEPRVNAAMAYAALGDYASAEAELTEALKLDPANPPALFNMGLIRNQQGRTREAADCLRQALKNDPAMAEAAYNLAVILSTTDLKEAVEWARTAYRLRPEERYGYTLGFYLKQKGDWEDAVSVFSRLIDKYPRSMDAYLLLGEIYEKKGRPLDAQRVYLKGLQAPDMPEQYRRRLESRLRGLR